MKREDLMRPYDPKKSVWVPTETHDFKEGLLESDDGTKAVVQVGHEVILIYSNWQCRKLLEPKHFLRNIHK